MLRFSENRRSTGLATTTNPRTSLSAHGLVEATQSQAEGGTVTGRYMSPLRVAQAVSYQVPGTITAQVLAYNLGQFSATTSAQLKSVISDETGSGALVFANSPTLVTPNIGAATGTTLTADSYRLDANAYFQMQSSNPLFGFDANDYMVYDRTNNNYSYQIAGNTKFKIDNTATARDTALLLYDVDNNTVERVTVGVADSGGAGFKLLRIPN